MKKILLFIAASFAATSSFAQSEQDISTLKDLGEPKLTSEGASSVVLFGDPQTYTQFAQNHGIFQIMTAWTAANRQKLNIRAALCTGDLVQYNGTVKSVKKNSDQSNLMMWRALSHALENLDNKIPFITCSGNHDYGFKWSENRDTHFPDFITPERNSKTFDALIECAPNANGIQSLENAAYSLDLGPKWGSVIIITLEFKPRQAVLDWAKKLLNRKEYLNSRAIILTHFFLSSNAQIPDKCGYKVSGSSPKQIFDSLVSQCPNIKMVISGHVGMKTFSDTSAHASFKNLSNQNVFAMMFNPQTIGGGYCGNGGDGWLRIFEFQPDGSTVIARTFSPLFAISPITKKFSWRTADCDSFSFNLDR